MVVSHNGDNVKIGYYLRYRIFNPLLKTGKALILHLLLISLCEYDTENHTEKSTPTETPLKSH